MRTADLSGYHSMRRSDKELEEKVAEARYLLKTDQYVIEPDDITVYDYAEKWIRTYKSVKELNTNRMYMESLKYVVGPAIGEIKMSKSLLFRHPGDDHRS